MKRNDSLKKYWRGYRAAKTMYDDYGLQAIVEVYNAFAYNNPYTKGYKKFIDKVREGK